MKHFQLPKFLSEMDYLLFALMGILIGIGILSIASAGVDAEGLRFSNEYLKQAAWASLGLFIMVAVMGFDVSRLKDYMIFVYLFVLVLLVYTRLAGKTVNGARSWVGIGEYGLQPSEFAKLATVLYLARYLESNETKTSIARLVGASAIVMFPVLLILSQPDFGSALVFFPILIVMLYVDGVDARYVLFIVLTMLATFVLLILPLAGKYFFPPGNLVQLLYGQRWLLLGASALLLLLLALSLWGWIVYKRPYYFWIAYVLSVVDISILISWGAGKLLKEYQVMRLMVFLNPKVDPQGAGWNIIQSVTAIGSGGLFGKGYLQGPQSHARFIPQQSTDFIFSIIAEEWGFIGVVVLIALFGAFLYRIVRLMETTKDKYSALVCSGFFGMFFFHFMINVGMAMGVMPITGIPLYFLSYGGSSLWAAMTAVGVMLGISARRYRM